MKYIFKVALFGVIMCVLNGCATLFTGTSSDVRIDSEPQGVPFTIYNRKNQIVTTGQTPQIIDLNTGAGYFVKASYLVEFKRPDLRDERVRLNSKFQPLYLGNVPLAFLFVGLPGMLLIDPLTGGMWDLTTNRININMTHTSPQPNLPQIVQPPPPPHTLHNTGIPGALERVTQNALRNVAKGSRVAIVNVVAPDRSQIEFITGDLEIHVSNMGYRIIDRLELDRIRTERELQISWEVDEHTAVSIGKFAGADFIITGRIDGEGDLRRLRLRVLDTQTAEVAGVAAEPF